MEKAKSTRNFDELVSKLTGNEILTIHAMSCVRGGDGEGNELIIILPPKP